MDPLALATTTTALLAPYLAKVGEKALEKIGEQLPEKVGAVWNGIWNRIKEKPSAADAANDLVTDAEDEGNQQIFTTQLKKALEKDENFASLLADLIEKAKSEASKAPGGDEITTSANNNSNAVGKISVPGRVGGNIVIGNNNQAKSNTEK